MSVIFLALYVLFFCFLSLGIAYSLLFQAILLYRLTKGCIYDYLR